MQTAISVGVRIPATAAVVTVGSGHETGVTYQERNTVVVVLPAIKIGMHIRHPLFLVTPTPLISPARSVACLALLRNSSLVLVCLRGLAAGGRKGSQEMPHAAHILTRAAPAQTLLAPTRPLIALDGCRPLRIPYGLACIATPAWRVPTRPPGVHRHARSRTEERHHPKQRRPRRLRAMPLHQLHRLHLIASAPRRQSRTARLSQRLSRSAYHSVSPHSWPRRRLSAHGRGHGPRRSCHPSSRPLAAGPTCW